MLAHPFDGQSVGFVMKVDFFHGSDSIHERFAEELGCLLTRSTPRPSIVQNVGNIGVCLTFNRKFLLSQLAFTVVMARFRLIALYRLFLSKLLY